nr:polygalacturonase-like [Tanacetum cinerariifolium]
MVIKYILVLFFLIFQYSTAKVTYNVVTLGAKADGRSDTKKAFLKAWNLSCASTTPAIIYVPAGSIGSLGWELQEAGVQNITVKTTTFVGVKISNVVYEDVHGTSATQVAVKFDCNNGSPCNEIRLKDVNLVYAGKPAVSSCSHAAVLRVWEEPLVIQDRLHICTYLPLSFQCSFSFFFSFCGLATVTCLMQA